jgi:uncharacterized membrane protein
VRWVAVSVIEQIVGTLFGRWYVSVFGLVFLVLAVRHIGAIRTAIYSPIAIAVGALAENSSVLTGFPYTRYTFNPGLRGHELWIFEVPLMVPLSYGVSAYFAFAGARLIVSGPYVTRGRQAVLEFLLATVLATWAVWILDPVSRLGRYFFLGELFQYEGPGFWFGLPLGSQVGYFFTAGSLVAILTVMMRNEPTTPVPRLTRHPGLPALLTYAGQVLFMAGSAFYAARTNDAAAAVALDALAGATLIIGIPMVLLVAIHWRSLPRPGTDPPLAPDVVAVAHVQQREDS